MFTFKNISDFHQSLLGGVVTCRQVVDDYLDRIRSKSSLNAFVDIFDSEAQLRADDLDRRLSEGKGIGKLHGVVVSIKDVLSYKGHRLTAASRMLSEFEAIYSATVVQRMLDEGAIIIGSCNCDEFAMGSTNENSNYGRVKNPVDEEKVSGGSSGGSAVAVSADLCMVSLGSDTGGSVRQPADFCGVVGFKPPYGMISRNGLIAYASSFDQVGIFAKNISDVRLVLDVISGPDEFDSTVMPKRTHDADPPKELSDLHIGIFENALNYRSLDEEIKNAILRLAKDIKGAVQSVDTVDISLIDYVVPTYYILTTAEASSNLSRYDGVRYGFRDAGNTNDLEKFYKANRSAGFGWEVKKRIVLGTYVLSEGYFDAYFTKAQKVRNMLVREADSIFNKFDVVMMPTVPETAFAAGTMKNDPVAMYLADIFTVYANLTGLPAISIPLFRHSNGMPFGVQLLSRKQNEVNLLKLSEHLLHNHKRYEQ